MSLLLVGIRNRTEDLVIHLPVIREGWKEKTEENGYGLVI